MGIGIRIGFCIGLLLSHLVVIGSSHLVVIASAIWSLLQNSRSTAMDSVFFALPPEIRQLTLSYVPPQDLVRLFLLDDLLHPNGIPDRYLIVRHQALVAKHTWSNPVMSNDEGLANFTVAELNYLIRHQIYIHPREITFAVYDFTNYPVLVKYMRSLFERYLPHLVKFTRNFNIRLILTENVTLDNSLLRFVFEPLCSSQYNVTWFTIKYLPGCGKIARQNSVAMNLTELFHSGTEIAVENLRLHLFSSANLLKHLVDTNGCFYCDNLRTLDLSFNNLTEWSLRNLQFPPTLEHLNLSNNQLHVLCNSNFCHQNLTNLRVLNLSNNNLRRIELHDYRTGPNGPYALELVDLSGNILSEYAGMFASLFFLTVKKVDLSFNLLEHVTKFPPLVTYIDLSGNYLNLDMADVRSVFPRGLRKLRVGSNGTFSTCGEEIARQVIEESGLWDLQELQICGSGRECPCRLC